MKRFLQATAALSMFAIGGAAQDIPVLSKLIGTQPVMGNAVKGAPYSAEESTESLQVLADGTRISHQSQVAVYRDGEGRVRRDSPTEITIWDPVASVSYTLNPKSMTAVKLAMSRATLYTTAAGARIFSDRSVTITEPPARNQAAATDVQKLAESLDKLKAELAQAESATSTNGGMMVNGSPATEQTMTAMTKKLLAAREKLSQVNADTGMSSKAESLGRQLMYGVAADGTRTTTTIEVGAIGNDRPIQVVSERWYSTELQTLVMTRRTDPRTGEETFRLANIKTGEPGADLFLLPPGYQVTDTSVTFLAKPVKKEE